MTRDDIQLAAKEAAIEALTTNGRASLKVGTGVGKGKTVLDVLAHFDPPKITWLIDSEDGRDNTDPSEFIKWGYEYLLDRTVFACYQTAAKWSGQDLGFVVQNEADFGATEVYSRSVSQNQYDKLFCVTATISEDKQWFFDKYAPVVYDFSTQQAQDEGILNKTKYVFVDYLLDTSKTYKVETKYKSWYSSEQEVYSSWDSKYNVALLQWLKYKKIIDDHYANPASIGVHWPEYQGYKSKRNAGASAMKFASMQRANTLYKLDSSKKIAKDLLRRVLDADSSNKTIVFSTFTNQVDSICKFTHHSKNNHPEYISQLNQGDIRCLGVVGKINRGTNLVGVNNFIYVDYDGSATKGSQRIGRGTRLAPDQVATIYILRPYFRKRVRLKNEECMTYIEKIYPTRMVGWAESMLSNFNINESNSELIKLY